MFRTIQALLPCILFLKLAIVRTGFHAALWNI